MGLGRNLPLKEAHPIQVHCLMLSRDEELPHGLDAHLHGSERRLNLHRVSNLGDASALLKRETLSLVVAQLPRAADAGGTLSAQVAVRCVRHLPVVLVVGNSPSEAETERLRMQGVSHIVIGGAGEVSSDSRVAKILRHGSWQMGQLQPGLTRTLLQQLSARKASALVTIGCPHGEILSIYPWQNSTLFYCSDDPSAQCKGWYGRVYLVNGNVVYAETPKSRGVHALADMLTLNGGTVALHSVWLPPPERNLEVAADVALKEADALAKQRMAAVAAAAAAAAPVTVATAPVSMATAPVTMATAPVSMANAPVTLRSEPPQAQVSTNQAMVMAVKGTTSMNHGLRNLLATTSQLRGAVKTDPTGTVCDSIGEQGDETTVAAVSLSAPHFEEIAQLLGLGEVKGWTVSTGKDAMYVNREGENFVTAWGAAGSSPEVTLIKINKMIGKV